MTDRPMTIEWDDVRLAAAFRARFDVEPPSALAARIVTELAGRPRSKPVGLRRWSFGLAAAVLTLVVILLGAQAGLIPWLPRSTSSPGPSASGQPRTTPAGSPTPTPTEAPFPTQVTVQTTGATLPVVSVANAITVRDGGVNSQELAVGGWYEFNVVPCPRPSAAVDSLLVCPLDFAWLMTDPEQLATTSGNGDGSFRQPSSPAIHPVVGLSPALDFLLGSYPDPVHVVFVGHFDDPIAADCSVAGRQACADRFIVDQLGWPNGPIPRTVPTSVADLTVQSVSDAIAAHDGQERAVAGWYQSSLKPLNCAGDWEYVVLDGCMKPYAFLMQDPEAILVATEGIRPPTGPGFGVTFDGFDNTPIDPGRDGPDGPTAPTQVVLIGHFMDRRVQVCPTDVRQACAQQFVVDAIGWLSGRLATIPGKFDLRDGGYPAITGPQLQAEQGFAATHGAYTVLNTVKVPGDRAYELEPGITDAPGIDLSGTVWFIHAFSQDTPGIANIAIFAIDPQGAVFTDGGGGWGRGS